MVDLFKKKNTHTHTSHLVNFFYGNFFLNFLHSIFDNNIKINVYIYLKFPTIYINKFRATLFKN